MRTQVMAVLLCLCGLTACDSAEMQGTQAAIEKFEESDDFAEVEIPRTAESIAPPPTPEGAPRAEQRPTRDPAPNPQKVIYTAAVRAQVVELDTALARVTQMVARSGGYLSSQHRTNNTYRHEAELVIRLPAGQLQSTLDFLPELAQTIDYQNLDSRNVTAEWIDLETRLQTKRDVRDRYIDILRNRAQKVEDILNAEDKIRVITEEIEAKEGRLRYLRDQVSLSTLTLELYETQEYRATGETYTRSFGSRIGSALAFGWELIQEIVIGLLAIWPILILAGVAIFFLRRRWLRRRGREDAA